MTNKTKLNRAQRRLQERRQRRSVAGAHQESAPSPPRALAPSSSHASREGKFAFLEQHDGFAFLRNRLREISKNRGDWAGIPMPLHGERLVVEPTYPNAQALMSIGGTPGNAAGAAEDGVVQINSWYSRQRRAEIIMMRLPSGRVDWGLVPAVHSLPFALSTLNCAEAWGIEQESNAVNLLGTLVSHRQFKQYMLTGMFIESSKRSKTAYLFRRLRPTVAIAIEGEGTRILCALCMHPIAYYASSWAGAMCPTDDVVAHLMMMRGDEAMFWRRSSQHAAWRPEAGL